MRSIVALAVATSLLAACTPAAESDEATDAAIERAEEQLEDASFADVGDTNDCTEDCSGHEAGFEWARENGLTDPSECGGNSPSFIEGCEAYTSALEDTIEDEPDRYEADY